MGCVACGKKYSNSRQASGADIRNARITAKASNRGKLSSTNPTPTSLNTSTRTGNINDMSGTTGSLASAIEKAQGAKEPTS